MEREQEAITSKTTKFLTWAIHREAKVTYRYSIHWTKVAPISNDVNKNCGIKVKMTKVKNLKINISLN